MNAQLRPANLPLTTQAAEGLPRRRFSVAEIEAMVLAGVIDADERFELIGGEVVPMSPKSVRHEEIKIKLNRFLQRVSPEHLEIAQETTLRLDPATYVELDFCVFQCDAAHFQRATPQVFWDNQPPWSAVLTGPVGRKCVCQRIARRRQHLTIKGSNST